jgi:hypothetical protein
MPDKITQVNRDVRSDVKASVGSLGKLKAGEVGIETDVVAKNLFEKYPNTDRIMIAEMMAATYCPLLRSKTLKDSEKLRLWSEFSDRVFRFANPSYNATAVQTSKPKEETTPRSKSYSPPPCVAMHGLVEFKSDPGDYIGGGQSQSLTEKDGLFCATVNSNNDIDIRFHGDDYWTLSFAPPQGQRIAAGEYNNATRAAFHSPVKPGLDVSGAGRGCNTLQGSFSVRRIDYARNRSLAVFVADFEQHCEQGTPALRGTIRLQTTPLAETQGSTSQ